LGYTSCLPGDLGLVVTDGAANGILEAYDNPTRTWYVTSLNTFTPGAAVTIGGGVGAGTLTAAGPCGFTLLGNQTANIAINEVVHVRGGLNKGWYTAIIAPYLSSIGDTVIVVAQTVAYLSIAASFGHWNITGSEFATIGVDKIAQYDGVAWFAAATPTIGITALITTLGQFYTFGGNIWALFAATVDHSALLNLGVDSHTQYLLLAGRAAGQSAYGGNLGATNLDLYANSVTAGTAHIALSDTNLSVAALAATNIAFTVGVGAPMTMYTTYSDVLTLHPTTTGTQDLGDATHVWLTAHLEEVRIYDTTAAEYATITRTLSDLSIDVNGLGAGNFNLYSNDIYMRLSDNLGARLFCIYNSSPAIVFQVNSLGILSGSGIVIAYVGAADSGKVVALDAAGMIDLDFIVWGSVDHNSLNNLAVGDVHTQYALLAGRAGGQILNGGTNPNDVLVLRGSDGADGFIDLQDLTYLSNGETLRYRDTGGMATDTWESYIATAGAVATIIASWPMTDLRAICFETTVMGIQDGVSNRALYHLSACAFRAGATNFQGVPVSIHSEESDPAWDCYIGIAGNTVNVYVVGVAVTTIRWTAMNKVTEVM
jgi:hypothetical protein